MRRQRDLRTSHERWEQGIAEGYRRGWYQQLLIEPPEGIFGGWDHTKKPNRHTHTNISPIEIRSRGRIPPNVRDDTDDTLSIRVTSYPPLHNVDQTQTCRAVSIQGLPAQKSPPVPTDLSQFLRDMKAKDGMLSNFHEVGGLRWIEWCAWDEEYVWTRFTNGLKYKGYPETLKTNSLTDWGYRRVRDDMEKLACQQGIRSWATRRKTSELEEEALTQRFVNTMELLNANYGSSHWDFLPDSWALMVEGGSQQDQRTYADLSSKRVSDKVLRYRASLPSWWLNHLFQRLEFEWHRELDERLALMEKSGLPPPNSFYIGDYPQAPQMATQCAKPMVKQLVCHRNIADTFTADPSEGSISAHHILPGLPDAALSEGRAVAKGDHSNGNSQMNHAIHHSPPGLGKQQPVMPNLLLSSNLQTVLKEEDTNQHSHRSTRADEDIGNSMRSMALGNIGSGRRAPFSNGGLRDRYGLNKPN